MKQLRLDNPGFELKVEILSYFDDSIREVLYRPKRCIQPGQNPTRWRHFGMIKDGEFKRGGLI